MDCFEKTFKRLNTAVIGLMIIFFGLDFIQNWMLDWPRVFVVLGVYGFYIIGVGFLIKTYGRHPRFEDQEVVTPDLLAKVLP